MKMERRAWLAYAASLAAAFWPRKPLAQEAGDQDGGIGELLVADPPKVLPALSWLDADGGRHSLSDYAGQGVLLNFWATWCGPCVAELPSLARLAAQLKERGVVVVPVSTDAGGAADVRRFYAGHGITGLGVWLDPRQEAMDRVAVLGLPTTLIIDRKGRESARMAGGTDWMAPGTDATIQALCDF